MRARNLAKSKKVREYVWYWVGGGYNSCLATSTAEAFSKASEMGRATGTFRGLHVASGTLHVAAKGEVAALDRQYASLFY